MAKNEKNIQTKILNDLRSLGRYCECFKIIKTSDSGEPDIFFTTAFTGAVLIETKRPTGVVKKIQKTKIAKLNRCGTPTYVCHSIEQWLKIKAILQMTILNIQSVH